MSAGASDPGQAQRTHLIEVAALVRRRIGIRIEEKQLPLLAAAIGRIRPGLRAEELLLLVCDPQAGERAVERLIDEVTVKETYFFRNAIELKCIDWTPSLRVWNPGCATGEESYTLAMMALDALGNAGSSVSILATDVAPTALERAREGNYGEHSLRSVPVGVRERHLRHLDSGRFTVAQAARDLVHFAPHNLIADGIPLVGGGQFDVIVCRNVLIYFDAETAKRTIGALRRALVPDGRLVLGAADRLAASEVPRQAAPIPRPPRGRSPGAAIAAPPAAPRADSLDAHAHFAHGLAMRAAGNAADAIISLRRAVYLAPDSARAPFELAREYEASGDPNAARRAYHQALWALGAEGSPEQLHAQRDADDVRAACSARLEGLDREGGLR